MLACNKTDYQNQCFDSSFGINQANKEFAIILSKALYNESELRQFIKDESLKKKDYDTDVFYPWVKDVEVCDGETFEQVLMKYDAENKLGDILAANPLLTMLLPDWSWVDPACFSPDKWDITRPEIGVGYLDGADTHPLICNGEVAFSMKDGEFLDVPVIIVKQNDRLCKVGGTKCGNPSYGFKYEDFIDVSSNNSTKGESRYTTINLPYEVATDSLMLSEMAPQLVTAYGVNQTNPYASQRDNIYYGMTATVDSGLVNRNVYETLVKFKINPSTIRIYDDSLGLGNDYKKRNIITQKRMEVFVP